MGSHRSSQSLVIVEHGSFFNLYLSDETGTYYSLSLKDIVVDIHDLFTYDFDIDLEIVSICTVCVYVHELKLSETSCFPTLHFL